MGFLDRFRNAWNIFKNKDPTWVGDTGPGNWGRPDRMRFSRGNERSIITAVFNRIAIDVADTPIQHVRTDENGRYLETIQSPLNTCLTLEANVDQTGRAFIQDAVQSLLDEGCVALVPTCADDEPGDTNPGGFDVYSMRTAKVTEWYPNFVKVNIYNEFTGRRVDKIVPKATTAIIENPMYAVMNEPSSTMQRLARKLALLDVVDEKTSSGRLDMIIQLPYVIKTPARREQAEIRRKDIERQLTEGPYGIAYTDGTEKIVRLNRPLENNLMSQIEYLTNLLFSQIGVTQAILDGAADEKTLQNYRTRVVEMYTQAFVDEMRRKFLTKTARTQGQDLMYFPNAFKSITAANLAELADKLRRNSIATANEIRQMIGWKPSQDTKADTLDNPNLSQPAGETPGMVPGMEEMPPDGYEVVDPGYEQDPGAYQSAILPVGGSGKPLPGDKRSVLPKYHSLPAPVPNRKKIKGDRGPRGPTG